jgi:hypothetical protein
MVGILRGRSWTLSMTKRSLMQGFSAFSFCQRLTSDYSKGGVHIGHLTPRGTSLSSGAYGRSCPRPHRQYSRLCSITR